MPKPAKQRGIPKIQDFFESAIANKDVKRVRELLATGHKPDALITEQAVDACILAATRAQTKEKPLFGRMPSKKEQEKAAADAEAYYEIAEAFIGGGARAPESLCSAARCGHTKLALLLIRAGTDVDYQPPMGTPLENAVSAGNVEIVRALIKAGADLHHQGIGGTLLTRAVDADEIEVAKELIKAGIDMNAVPRFGASALLAAVTERKAQFVQLLLDSGADVNQKGSVVCGGFGKPEVKVDGMFRTTHVPNPPVARDATPLIVAARRGYADIAAQLIAANADVDASDAEGFTASVYALKAHAEPLIKLLKGAGAKSSKYSEGSLEAAWVAAAKAGDCARLRDLVRDGVDVNVKYAARENGNDKEEIEEKATALKYAAENGHVDAVKLLLASGARVNEKFGGWFERAHETALMHAARAGHLEVARALIAAGAAATAKDCGGKTVLHYAAEGGNAGMIELLVKRGANVEAKTKGGTTPLMEAAGAGHAGMITALVKARADPNRSTDDNTALWHAAYSGHVVAVQALLDAGADPKAGDKTHSPLDAASSQGHKDVVNLLLKPGKDGTKGAGARKAAETQGAALVNAIFRGQIEIARTLLESGADPSASNENHFTALMGAVQLGYIELVQTLLKAGADVNALNEKGKTALDLADENVRDAEGRAMFLRLLGRRDNFDAEITKALKKAGGKPAKELRGKTVPHPSKPEKKRKEPVEVEVPDFSKRAKKPEFVNAIKDLVAICGKSAKPVTNREDNPLTGCVSFRVPAETADKILKEKHEEFLKRGCYLLKSDRGFTSGKDTLTLLPTTDRAEVLAAYQTNGANFEVYTPDIVHWLDELEKTQPFVMTGAGFDWCEGAFTKPLVDSKKLAKQMYEFCPDIVSQGTGDVSRLALELKKAQRFFFWWD
jgi:ankyrin repeat protein